MCLKLKKRKLGEMPKNGEKQAKNKASSDFRNASRLPHFEMAFCGKLTQRIGNLLRKN